MKRDEKGGAKQGGNIILASLRVRKEQAGEVRG